MPTVVLDSSNIPAILADAHGEPAPTPPAAENSPAEPSSEDSVSVAAAEPQSELEDENGLTASQKRELTTKMLKAIGKKHRELKEAEEFAASQYSGRRDAEQRIALLQKELDALKASAPAPAAKAPEAPKREAFKSEAEFQDAMIDYKVEQKLAAQREADAKALQEKQTQEIIAQAEARLAAARELVPDFDEVVGAIDTEVPPYIAGYMQRSAMFAELGYHFAQNPDVLERLSRMRPEDALVEVGEIKSTLKPFAPSAKANGKAPESKTNGSAPRQEQKTDTAPSETRTAPVIRPLATGSGSQVEKAASDRSYAEERAYWEKKNGTRLARRSRH